jgi:hypothetical protein
MRRLLSIALAVALLTVACTASVDEAVGCVVVGALH